MNSEVNRMRHMLTMARIRSCIGEEAKKGPAMKLLTTREAAELLRICRQSVCVLCNEKKLACIRHRPNGKRLIPMDSVTAYLASMGSEVEAYTPAIVAFDDVDKRMKERSARIRRAK